MKTSSFEKKLAGLSRAIDRNLMKYSSDAGRYPAVIYNAMEYSLMAGGKRLRPALLLLSAKACGLSFSDAMPFACAIEMIHTYSLIHDDLPAMDDDDLRRGKPTSHKKFGEAIAILSGDALLNRAFETALLCRANKKLKPENVLEAAAYLAKAAGASGMIGGQVLDITSENKKIGRAMLSVLHEKKTGALIRASVVCGALLSGAGPEIVKKFSVFGEKAGLAFQIADDVLDATGDEKKMGKKARKDAAAFKATYPSVYGLDKSVKTAKDLVLQACGAIYKIKGDTAMLRETAQFMVSRTY
jgi:geranylgeranyl diphosphate synthase type II